jgi:hypothetical protein
MNKLTNDSMRKLLFIIVMMLAGIIVTIGVTEYGLNATREVRHKYNPDTGNLDIAKLPDAPLKMPEKTIPQVAPIDEVLEGFFPPVNKEAPLPANSKKSNNTLDNLMFALSFYDRMPFEDEISASVVGWDPDSGYYLPDKSTPIMSLARNVRYLLILKLYLKLYPTTKYFDTEAVRVEDLVKRQLEEKNLDSTITNAVGVLHYIPEKLFFDLLDLSKLTQDKLYRDSALKVGDKIGFNVTMEASLVKSNRDRTDKVNMFADAAVGYILGKETGRINLTQDAQILIDELIKELWTEKYKLFYTSSAIGQLGNITETFITADQMHALVNIVRFASAAQNEELGNKVQTILTTMADGSNVICDTKRFGFFRRYSGKGEAPHEDYKTAEDHIAYLEAWIRLNMMRNGEFEKILNSEYDGYEMFLYNEYTNCIYLSYEMDWKPRPEDNGKPLASADAILDYLLITLQDRAFSAEHAAGR